MPAFETFAVDLTAAGGSSYDFAPVGESDGVFNYAWPNATTRLGDHAIAISSKRGPNVNRVTATIAVPEIAGDGTITPYSVSATSRAKVEFILPHSAQQGSHNHLIQLLSQLLVETANGPTGDGIPLYDMVVNGSSIY